MVFMDNLALFINRFLEYLILLVVIVIVAALGFAIGRFFGKRKDAKKAMEMENNEA